MGAYPVQSTNDYSYYISFLDDHTRYSWIFPLKTKGEAFTTFKQLQIQVQRQHGNTIKTVRCDGGGEFKPFLQYGKENGIGIQISCPYISVQNGRIERKHRHIVEIGLSLLAQAKMPLFYWWEAFHTTVYLINRMPSPIIGGDSPYLLSNGYQPIYEDLRTFGPTC